MKIRKAVIPAAGLGTRFLPATKAQPKEMLPLVDKPTIQYIVEEAVAAGIEEILLISGRTKKSIEDHFDRSPELEAELIKSNKLELLKVIRDISDLANIHSVRQKEPRGLGHAILTAKAFVGNEPFAVLLGDDVVASKKPCLKQLIEVYEEKNATILGVQTVAHEDVSKYGIVDGVNVGERLYKVRDLVEKPPVEEACSDIAILGRYVISPDIFEYLENQTPGAGGEIQLTDALKRMANDGKEMYAYDFKGTRYDVGSKIGFVQANIEFALRDESLRDELKEYLEKLNKNIDKMIDYD